MWHILVFFFCHDIFHPMYFTLLILLYIRLEIFYYFFRVIIHLIWNISFFFLSRLIFLDCYIFDSRYFGYSFWVAKYSIQDILTIFFRSLYSRLGILIFFGLVYTWLEVFRLFFFDRYIPDLKYFDYFFVLLYIWFGVFYLFFSGRYTFDSGYFDYSLCNLTS